MAITQDVVVLNDFGLERRDRTSSKGTKSRYTVTIESEPILHQFDGLRLGKRVSEAMAKALRDGVRGILAYAKPATIARRQRAADALQRGAQWAKDRYSGGRTGLTPPQTGASRLWNDSGRFADGIIAMENKVERGWTINVPANRLDPKTFTGGEAALEAEFRRLVALVPAFGDPAKLGEDAGVKRAIDESFVDLIVSAARRGDQLRGQLVRTVLGTLGGASGRLVGNVLTLHLG